MKRENLIITLLLSCFVLSGCATWKERALDSGLRVHGQDETLVKVRTNGSGAIWCGDTPVLVYYDTYEGLFVHDIKSGERVMIKDAGSVFHRCSPDGKWLVYGNKKDARFGKLDENREVIDLWRYELKSGKREKFAAADLYDVDIFIDEIFSPNGKRLFLGRPIAKKINMEEPKWGILRPDGEWATSSAVWLGDSAGIASTRWDPATNRDIIEVLTPEKKTVTIDPKLESFLLSMVDKKGRLYMKVWANGSPVAKNITRCEVDIDLARASCETVLEREKRILDFDIFPDGNKIAFTEEDGRCVMAADIGEEPYCVAPPMEEQSIGNINISPDGKYLAFYSYNYNTDSQLDGLYVTKIPKKLSIKTPEALPEPADEYFYGHVEEIRAINKDAPYVRRDGGILYLRLKSGAYHTLPDLSACVGWDTCRDYTYVDYFKEPGYFHLRLYLGEPTSFLMLSDKTGKEYEINQTPHFSPDKKHFITVSASDAFDINGVFVYRLEEEEIVNELYYEPEEYAMYSFVSWKDNETVLLSKLVRPDNTTCGEEGLVTVPASLALKDGEWRFSDDPTAVICDDVWPSSPAAKEYELKEKISEFYRRDGYTLHLKLKSGEFIKLTELDGCGNAESKCKTLRLHDYLQDIGFYLLTAGSYYPEEYFLVSDKTGKEYAVHSPPAVSPDKKHLVAVSGDGYTRNGIFVWRLTESGLTPDFTREWRGYSPYKFTAWKDDQTIEISKLIPADAKLCPQSHFMTVPMTLSLDDNGWNLIEEFSADSVVCDVE